MADPFDRAWDFMKNEDEDPKRYNSTGDIDPNRSSRIVDMFSGLRGHPSHPQPKEHNIQIPRKFSDLTPSHERPPMEEDYDSKLMDILDQIRQGGKPSDIYGSPPFNPSQQDYDEAFKHPDVIEAKPPAKPYSERMPGPMIGQKREPPGQHPDMGRGPEEDKPNPQRRIVRREPQGQHPDMGREQSKPKLGEGLIGRSKKALDEEKAERAKGAYRSLKEKKSQEGNKGGNEPKESDGDKDE